MDSTAGNLLALDMNLPASRYATGIQQTVFLEQVTAKLATFPGVRAVSLAGGDPLSNGGIDFGTLEAEGRAITDADKDLVVPITEVSSDYLRRSEFRCWRAPICGAGWARRISTDNH